MMKSIKLLAHDRYGFLGNLLHGTAKDLLRAQISLLHKTMEPVIKYKLDNGWINPEIKLLYEEWGQMLSLDENDPIYGFTQGKEDKNRIMMYDVRDIFCVIMDEDTHYLLRLFALVGFIFDDKEKWEATMDRNNGFFDWRAIYERNLATVAQMKALSESGEKV